MSKQETEGSSQGEKLSLSALLQLKKCERPEAAFWEKFERQLQQRQLQALVKPTWKERFFRVNVRLGAGAWLAPAAVAVVALALSWEAFTDREVPLARDVQPTALENEPSPPTQLDEEDHEVANLFPEADDLGAEVDNRVAEVAVDQPTSREEPKKEKQFADASFVYDAIRPDAHRRALETFRTVDHPDTLHARGEGEPSAQYVVNTYETRAFRRMEVDSLSNRFRVYSDLYGSGPATRFEGGVSMEF